MNRALLSSIIASSVGESRFSFESADIETAMDSDELIESVVETTGDQRDIETMIEQSEQLERQAEGLEDLAMAADRVTESTDNEIILAEMGAELATIGTDAKVSVLGDDEGLDEDGNVSLEAYTGKSISTEGIKQMAKKFYDAIVKLVNQIWEKVLKFWRKITDQSKSLVKQAKKLTERASSTSGKELSEGGDQIDVANITTALSVNGKLLKDGGAVLSGLATVKGEVEFFFDKMSKTVLSTGKDLEKALSSFDLKESDKSLQKVNGNYGALISAAEKHMKVKAKKDARFTPSAVVTRTEPLMGNRAVFLARQDAGKDSSALGLSAANRSVEISVRPIEDNIKEIKASDAKIKTFTPSDCSEVADRVTEIAELVGAFHNKTLDQLSDQRKAVKKAGDKVQKDINDETLAADSRAWQSALNYNTSFSKLATGVYTQLTSLALQVSRASMTAANASLSQYK